MATISAALAVGLVFSLLIRNEMNPSVFIAMGEDESIDLQSFAEERLGEVVLRPGLGHDGRFFFLQANDPWLTDTEMHAELLDRPVYRSQRMAYPVLASVFGLLPPTAVVWGMIAVNVLAMALGGFATAGLAVWMEGSPWWGLAFPLNIGLISEFSLGGAGVVAAAAAFLALYAIATERRVSGVALFTISCLAREVMLLAVAGCAAWLIFRKRSRLGAFVLAGPTLAVAAWGLFVRARLPAGGAVVEGNLTLPFVGFVQNWTNWISSPLEALIGSIVVVLVLIFGFRALRRRDMVGTTFVPYVFLMFLLAPAVWDGYFNLSRAVAPALTAYFLVTYTSLSETSSRGRRHWLHSEAS